jgi:hypothetical protein
MFVEFGALLSETSLLDTFIEANLLGSQGWLPSGAFEQ